jgi:hypothetical protein
VRADFVQLAGGHQRVEDRQILTGILVPYEEEVLADDMEPFF